MFWVWPDIQIDDSDPYIVRNYLNDPNAPVIYNHVPLGARE